MSDWNDTHSDVYSVPISLEAIPGELNYRSGDSFEFDTCLEALVPIIIFFINLEILVTTKKLFC